MKLLTVDIFDTALLRKCGPPWRVFELMAARLYPEDPAAQCAFVNWRSNADAKTIHEIYSALSQEDFPEYENADLCKIEMEVEASQLIGNPSIRVLLDRYRGENWNIKFLSDMYLPSEFLASVLRREGMLKDNEAVIVSCEHSARKDNGTLFSYVRKMFNPKQWIHFGDNWRSDVVMAKRNGVKPQFVDTRFNSVEQEIIDAFGRDVGIKLASSSRMARLIGGNSPEAILAADFVAPLYVGFVSWVLDVAVKQGLKALMFVNRDGYLMREIAKEMPSNQLDVDYLFISRKSLLPAFLDIKGEDGFIQILDQHTLLRKNVSQLLDGLSLDRACLKKEHGIIFEYEKITTDAQAADFLAKIFKNPSLTPALKSQWEQQHRLLLDYLKAKGFENKGIALVDVGWLGTSRLMLNAILEAAGMPTITTIYLGVRKDVLPRRFGNFIACFDPGRLASNGPALIEHYFSVSPWPSTAGYKRMDNGDVEPVFKEGACYKENSTILANVDACRTIARDIIQYSEIDKLLLKRWGEISLTALTSLSHTIDLQPLSTAEGIEKVGIIKRLSLLDTIKMVFTGKVVSECDVLSLQYSYGRRMARPLHKLASLSGKARVRLFNRFIASRR